MLETLLKLLKLGVMAPEIRLDDDGDIRLDYYYNGCFDISITPTGKVNWTATVDEKGDYCAAIHGTDLVKFIELLTNSERPLR